MKRFIKSIRGHVPFGQEGHELFSAIPPLVKSVVAGSVFLILMVTTMFAFEI